MQSISLLPVSTPQQAANFAQAQEECLVRDVFPSCDLDAPLSPEEQADLLSPERRQSLEALCQRETDPGQRCFFALDGQRVGYCFWVTFHSEDDKCFILDFCIFPPFRCQGIGSRCFQALREHTQAQGAAYWELNTHCRRSLRFWQRQGFVCNGYDAYGAILLQLPPSGPTHTTCGRLRQEDLWQLEQLENTRRAAAGLPFLTDAQRTQLARDWQQGKLRVWALRRQTRIVAICTGRLKDSRWQLRLWQQPAGASRNRAAKLRNYLLRQLKGQPVCWLQAPKTL